MENDLGAIQNGIQVVFREISPDEFEILSRIQLIKVSLLQCGIIIVG